MFRCSACGALNRVAQGRAGSPVCGKCAQALDVSGAPQEVTAEALDRAIASSPIPVLVDFWAPWCGPCRIVGPLLEQLGRAHPGELMVLKLNTEAHPQPSARLNVRAIPTFVLFQGGREVSRRSGAMPLPELERFVNPHLRPQGAQPQA